MGAQTGFTVCDGSAASTDLGEGTAHPTTVAALKILDAYVVWTPRASAKLLFPSIVGPIYSCRIPFVPHTCHCPASRACFPDLSAAESLGANLTRTLDIAKAPIGGNRLF